MIRHIVLTKFKAEISENVIAGIYRELEALSATLPGTSCFVGGRSKSPEQIERGYLHGFTIDFADWSDLERYANHPAHKVIGGKLVECAVGGIEGILVLDIES